MRRQPEPGRVRQQEIRGVSQSRGGNSRDKAVPVPLDVMQNGNSAEMHKPDPLRYLP